MTEPTHSIPPHLRKKREWTVADFAEHMRISHWQAKTRLQRINDECGGMLLIPSRGKNRGFTFYRASLAKAKPELFEPIDALTERVDDLETKIEDIFDRQRRLADQVGYTTREVARIRRGRAA